jgi:hypothetical protein
LGTGGRLAVTTRVHSMHQKCGLRARAPVTGRSARERHASAHGVFGDLVFADRIECSSRVLAGLLRGRARLCAAHAETAIYFRIFTSPDKKSSNLAMRENCHEPRTTWSEFAR